MKIRITFKFKKMKRVLLIIIMFAITLTGRAQQNEPKGVNGNSKLEAARIAMITERLNLTPAQAEKFWPVYNQFAVERRALQQNALQARKGYDMQNLTEEQSKTLLKAQMQFKQEKLDLENKYTTKINDVISSQQLVALKRAEEDFRAMLLNRLEQRKRQQIQREQMLNQHERKMQQGNN